MARRGRDILIKLSDGLSPPTFTTVGGMRTKSIEIGNESSTITSKDDEGWQQLIDNTGIRTMAVTGSGIFKDDATINEFENLVITGRAQEMQFVFANGDGIQGIFLVESFEHAGEHVGPQNYAMTLQSGAQDTESGLGVEGGTGSPAFQFIRGLYPDVDAPPVDVEPEPHVPNTVSMSNGPWMTQGIGSWPSASYKGIMSFWMRRYSTRYRQIIHGVDVSVSVSAGLVFNLKNSVHVSQLLMNAIGVTWSVGPWRHILMSYDISASVAHLYVDDVDRKGTTSIGTLPIDWTFSNPFSIFATLAGEQKFEGCFADFYINPDEYLDLSVEANRRKFIDAAGDPVYLGATGQLPTGNQPAAMFQGEGTGFNVNDGYGANASTQSGPFSICSDGP